MHVYIFYFHYFCSVKDFYRQLLAVLAAHYEAREAQAIAFLVCEEAFGWSKTDVYADKVSQLSTAEQERAAFMLRRLGAGEPVQYVLGTTCFDGRPFYVSPAVLIPRPETEELVRWAAEAARGQHFLDVGTGSGCIAISLKLRRPEASVHAWDISPEAIDVARKNAECLGADVQFEVQDLFTAPPKSATVVVSNPPYICEKERAEMAAHVVDFEPAQALFVPDDDPLRYYKALAQLGAEEVFVEINAALRQATADAFRAAGYQQIVCRKDEFGKDRFIYAC